MNTKGKLLALLSVAVLLAACGGAGDVVLDTPTADDPIADDPIADDPIADDLIATSVQQTLAAIAVAQTVEAIATGRATPPAEPPTAAPLTPTDAPLSPTDAPTSPPTQPPPTNAPPPTNTPPPPTPTTAVARPPVIENDAPGGSFPQDGSVVANIIVDPNFLFRMDVRVLAAGNFEGAGIDSVQFSISGDDVNYFREERTAGFCTFGGGEPHCNPWPRNASGQYTWGVDGPVVQSGDYFVNMAVTADEQDPEFFGQWNWNFPFTVTLP